MSLLKKRSWFEGEVMHAPDGVPPEGLTWTCEVCGVQPPIALSNQRWIKRSCVCQRAEREQRRVQKASVQYSSQLARRRETSMTRLSEIALVPALSQGTPPLELCWTCEVCGPVEPLFLPTRTGTWKKRSCACQIRARKEEEAAEQKRLWNKEQGIRTFGLWLGAKWVDYDVASEMLTKTFAGYDLFRQPRAYEKAFAFAQHPKGNMLLYGDYGVGKTHLEAAICNAVREQLAMTSLFVSAPQFFLVYEATKRAFDKTDHIRLVDQMISTPLLILDDVDKSRPNDARWEIYWEIFDERYRAKRPTILSTNKREELDRYIGEACLSRLSRGLVAVQMMGDDYRREEWVY